MQKGKWKRGKHTPAQVKSIAIATSVITHAKAATSAPSKLPMTPAPIESKKAMKATPHAIGCKIIA